MKYTFFNTVFTCILALVMLLPFAANAGNVMRLSLEQAVELARENNYTLKVAKSRVAQADARSLQVARPYLPTVTLSETFVYTNDPAGVFTYKLRQGSINPATDFSADALNNPDPIANFQLGLEVIQPIVNVDALKGRSAAKAAGKAAEYQLERVGDSIEYEVKKAYYGLVLARSNRRAINRSITAMQGHNRQAGKAYSRGLLTRSDKLSTSVRLAELKERKMVIEDEIRTASDGLRFLLQLDGDAEIVPVNGLNVEIADTARLDGNVATGRADLKALEARSEAAEYRYRMAKAGSLPRLNAFLQTNMNDDFFPGLDEHNWAVGLNMSWKIYDGDQRAGRMQEAKAVELESRYSYEEALDRSRFEIRKAERMLSTAQSRIAIARQALEQARVSLEYTGERYRSGMAMTFELLGSETAYTYAQMRVNKAKYDYIMAKHALDFAAGRQATR